MKIRFDSQRKRTTFPSEASRKLCYLRQTLRLRPRKYLMEFSATTLNLASIVSHHARLAPESEAIIWGDVRMTYRQLDEMSNRVAHALVEMGIAHGDKVALS